MRCHQGHPISLSRAHISTSLSATGSGLRHVVYLVMPLRSQANLLTCLAIFFRHLTALTGRDKPFYKLYQACAYTDDFVQVNRILDKGKPLKARALAVTMNGVEGIGATYDNSVTDVRTTLIKQLGQAYRIVEGIADDDEVAFEKRTSQLFESMR